MVTNMKLKMLQLTYFQTDQQQARLHFADNFDDWPDYKFESCNDRSGEGEVTCLKVKGKSIFALFAASSVESVGWVFNCIQILCIKS